MKKAIVVLAVLAIAATANANLLTNGGFETGDETGWSKWWAPWGGNATTVVSDVKFSGTYSDRHSGGGSQGLYQTVAVPIGTVVTVDAMWKGDNISWAELMLWTQAAPGGEGARADTGAAADIAFKRDNFGLNPPNTWDWQAASLSDHPSANNGTVVSQGYVVVATKLGNGGNLWFDDIVLTPEPTTLALMALGFLPFLRRRRA